MFKLKINLKLGINVSYLEVRILRIYVELRRYVKLRIYV